MRESLVLPNLLMDKAQQAPDSVLLRDVEGEVRTVGEVARNAAAWATALRQLGVAAGEAVLVMEPASILSFEIWLGIALLSAIEVPVNVALRGNVLRHVMADSEARVLITDERYAADLGRQAGNLGLRHVVLTGGKSEPADLLPPGTKVWLADGILASALGCAGWRDGLRRSSAWDVAAVLYTSGTTGRSKGVVIPWGQAYATAMGNGPDRALRTRDTVIYSPYPTFHVSGKYSIYNALLGGGTAVVREHFSISSFWSDVRSHGCTYTILMPTPTALIIGQPPRPDDANHPLRNVLFSPWPANVEEFKARFGVNAYSVFNMTEISCPIVAGWDSALVTKPRSCGRLRPGYQARVVDEHDTEVPAGSPGELVLRTDEPWTLMREYWRNPGATSDAFRNQWLHTGDLFMTDEDGDYFYLDRKSDSIRRRGENISSVEVESEVRAHPGVLEAAAVAVPDSLSGQEVKIFVVLKPGTHLDGPELASFLAGKMAAFMVPRYIEFVETLPRTPTGKIQKLRLRDIGITAETWDGRPEASLVQARTASPGEDGSRD